MLGKNVPKWQKVSPKLKMSQKYPTCFKNLKISQLGHKYRNLKALFVCKKQFLRRLAKFLFIYKVQAAKT